jgi:hypothetical protein
MRRMIKIRKVYYKLLWRPFMFIFRREKLYELNEFKYNRLQKWFSPRTDRYQKYIDPQEIEKIKVYE